MLQRIFYVVPIFVGVTVLLGWTIDNPSLERTGTPFVTMNPATAVGLSLIGFSLFLLKHSSKKVFVHFAMFFAAASMFIGMAKISDLIFHSNFKIDDRLFADQIAEGGWKLMAPNAALNFLLISLAIFLSRIKSESMIISSQVISIFCNFIAFLAAVGYTYGTISFYGLGAFTPMALQTALCFMFLSISVVGLHKEAGIMSCISNAGPAGRMARLLLPTAVCVPVMIGGLNMLGIRNGYYTLEFSNSLFVVTTVAMMFVLTWIGARWLYKQDLLRQKAEDELRYRAGHDRLTGLANRGVFFDMLQQRIHVMKRRGGAGFAVFYIDLDGFKQVNDLFGHEEGDKLLMAVADVLKKCTRACDVVARMGGDEFTILYEELKDASNVHLLAQRILETIPSSTGIKSGCPVSVSIGIAHGKVMHDASEDIIREADQALYAAKHAGKNRYEIWLELGLQSSAN